VEWTAGPLPPYSALRKTFCAGIPSKWRGSFLSLLPCYLPAFLPLGPYKQSFSPPLAFLFATLPWRPQRFVSVVSLFSLECMYGNMFPAGRVTHTIDCSWSSFGASPKERSMRALPPGGGGKARFLFFTKPFHLTPPARGPLFVFRLTSFLPLLARQQIGGLTLPLLALGATRFLPYSVVLERWNVCQFPPRPQKHLFKIRLEPPRDLVFSSKLVIESFMKTSSRRFFVEMSLSVFVCAAVLLLFPFVFLSKG